MTVLLSLQHVSLLLQAEGAAQGGGPCCRLGARRGAGGLAERGGGEAALGSGVRPLHADRGGLDSPRRLRRPCGCGKYRDMIIQHTRGNTHLYDVGM